MDQRNFLTQGAGLAAVVLTAEPNALLTQLALNAPDRDRIFRGNATRLFRL